MNTPEDLKIDWQSLIAEQERSGLSQKEFCVKNNITPGQFGYHKGLIKGKKHSYFN